MDTENIDTTGIKEEVNELMIKEEFDQVDKIELDCEDGFEDLEHSKGLLVKDANEMLETHFETVYVKMEDYIPVGQIEETGDPNSERESSPDPLATRIKIKINYQRPVKLFTKIPFVKLERMDLDISDVLRGQLSAAKYIENCSSRKHTERAASDEISRCRVRGRTKVLREDGKERRGEEDSTEVRANGSAKPGRELVKIPENAEMMESRIVAGRKTNFCLVCRYQSRGLVQMRRHLMIHTGEKPYRCEQCPKAFREPSHLAHHRLTHTGSFPHRCPLCPFRSHVASNLRQHAVTHTQDKRFRCEWCGLKCSRKTSLKVHIARKHPPQSKILRCAHCPYQTSSRSNLIDHLLRSKSHDPLKPPSMFKAVDHSGSVIIDKVKLKKSRRLEKIINQTGSKVNADVKKKRQRKNIIIETPGSIDLVYKPRCLSDIIEQPGSVDVKIIKQSGSFRRPGALLIDQPGSLLI